MCRASESTVFETFCARNQIVNNSMVARQPTVRLKEKKLRHNRSPRQKLRSLESASEIIGLHSVPISTSRSNERSASLNSPSHMSKTAIKSKNRIADGSFGPDKVVRKSEKSIALLSQREASNPSFSCYIIKLNFLIVLGLLLNNYVEAQTYESTTINASPAESTIQASSTCFGGLQTFEKISMSSFENPTGSTSSGASFGSGILVQQDDQALTSECVNLCRSQSNCLSFVIDYNKFECKSYATTQLELQQELDEKYQAARSINNASTNGNSTGGYQASSTHFQHLLPSASSNYFEKICLDGVANRNQFGDVCGQGRLWTIERVVDSFLDGYVEKEVTNVNSKDECSKLCIFETQFVCRSADYDQHSRLCRLSKEDRRTQPQAMRFVMGSNRHYLENQCATPGPSSCVYETKKNLGIISMDALKFAQTVQDCQMKCNQESTFNCRSYSFHQQRCFLSGDDGSSLNTNLIKLPVKQGWNYGEKKCLVELCTKGIFSYEKITGYTLRSALTTPIDLMMPGGSSLSVTMVGNNLEDLDKLQHESSQTKLRHLLPSYDPRSANGSSSLASSMMMMMMMPSGRSRSTGDPLYESESSVRHQRSASNLAITNHCRHSCDLGYLNCPAFTIDYRNNRCQRLDRNSQGRHNELVARENTAYYEKICLRVPEIMSMCQDKYWIFERVIGYELAPRLYEKSLKFVQSRRDCQEYCLEEKQFQCRSALYNDESSDCKLSRYDRRLATQEGAYYRNFNVRISYLENQCVRDHLVDKRQQCYYEQAREEPAYPTYTEHIEMVQPPSLPLESNLQSSSRQAQMNSSNQLNSRYGLSYCEQLCNENAKFECHSFGYYASTAQCFLSGDDTISAGDSATTPSTGFTYYEKKCRLPLGSESANHTMSENASPSRGPSEPTGSTQAYEQPDLNPYIQPPRNSGHYPGSNTSTSIDFNAASGVKPFVSNNNISIHIDQQLNLGRPINHKPDSIGNESAIEPDQYKCGQGHSFVYQRVSGFEPIGGYLTLLVKNNDRPGIVSECSELCRRAYECRAFVIDYNSNQCFAMLENSSAGLLSLRQTLGKDYFEGFCAADHILLSGTNCRNKTWIMDKIVDQATIGVQHQKVIVDTDRVQCRQACLEERLFWCKSAMFDSVSGDCKLYSIDRESMPQMRLLFTKGVDFFENQCQIVSNSCPYDAIERDMTMVTTTKSIQARSTFDCENACNSEITFNCRSYTYLEQNPSLPNLCLMSSDSRSTSQRGSVREHQRTLYAERNCYYRRPRFPGGTNLKPESMYSQIAPTLQPEDPYQMPESAKPHAGHASSDAYGPPPRLAENQPNSATLDPEVGPILGSQDCELHQFTFERTFGFDYRAAKKERAPLTPSVGIAIACQQECLRRGERCQSFVVDYALPFQNCYLIDTQVGANKRLLVKSPNSAYFEKICLPRLGVESESITHAAQMAHANQADVQSMDIAPSYSNEPWAPQVPNQLPYYLQQQQLVQNYPTRSCPKLWTFERFLNHNFTAASDRTFENVLTKAQCETHCLNEAGFSCRAATYDYTNKLCKLFKNTRRTMMSQFVDLESMNLNSILAHSTATNALANSQPGTAQVLTQVESETFQSSQSSLSQTLLAASPNRRQASARQAASTGEPSSANKNVDYMENTCIPEPSSCQYRQLYDLLSPYVDKINHAVSLSDCQRQCDLERLFSCKSINYDPSSKSCMLINEDLISLNRGQQASLLTKKNYVYSEKGNCEMVSVQCNSQEMLVSINFDAPFRGRIMAKGNPEQCFLIGDGQTSLQFPIVFGPKCNSRQEGHNTFVNEVIIQQHPVIMTESDKTVRVMCAFEAPDQTITLKSPSSRDNKTGIDVGTPESSRTRHDKQNFNSVVSNKASPPSVVLRILDPSGRDASMINLGDDLVLRIQMQMESQNSALGIFARNLAARSSNGESLLLIDNEGCPVDHQVFPALEIDPKDGKSLYTTFKAFRFPSSGLVNFEVQIRFCPERCQPVDCHKGQKMRSYGRKKRQALPMDEVQSGRTSVLESLSQSRGEKNPLDALSTVMKPGKAFQYVRELLLPPQAPQEETDSVSSVSNQEPTPSTGQANTLDVEGVKPELDQSDNQEVTPTVASPEEFSLNSDVIKQTPSPIKAQDEVLEPTETPNQASQPSQKSILMHVDEKVVPSTSYVLSRGLNQPHSFPPYGSYPASSMGIYNERNSHPNPMTSTPSSGDIFTEDTSRLLNSGNIATEAEPNLINVHSTSSTEETQNELMENKGSSEEKSSKVNELNIAGDSNVNGQHQVNAKEVPLRFSILVGENQSANSGGWVPGSLPPVLVMNSTNVELDHIVVPGKDGQLDATSSSEGSNSQPQSFTKTLTTSPDSTFGEANYQSSVGTRQGSANESVGKRLPVYDQTFDALSSNSVAAEIKINQDSAGQEIGNILKRHKHSNSLAESAASHDCHSDAGGSRLKVIIWTGSIVIILNVCLVVVSLLLYFKKIHLRQRHNIIHATSECGTHSSNSRSRWPSVLRGKNISGTSLNTHEHFFCKLAAAPSVSSGLTDHKYQWPNLSSSSSQSTISTGVTLNCSRKLGGWHVDSS